MCQAMLLTRQSQISQSGRLKALRPDPRCCGRTASFRFSGPYSAARRTVALLALGLFGCAAPDTYNHDLSAMLERAAPAVVSIASDSATIASGFFVDRDLVVSNQHVTLASPLYVVDPQGERHVLWLVSSDETYDVAVFRSSHFPAPAILSLSDTEPRVGERVSVVGNPFGAGITASAGIVSALPRAIGKQHLLQTDAAVNPGNSGGPLLNQAGDVIGIVTSRGAVGSGIGFAVPTEHIRAVVDQAQKSTLN